MAAWSFRRRHRRRTIFSAGLANTFAVPIENLVRIESKALGCISVSPKQPAAAGYGRTSETGMHPEADARSHPPPLPGSANLPNAPQFSPNLPESPQCAPMRTDSRPFSPDSHQWSPIDTSRQSRNHFEYNALPITGLVFASFSRSLRGTSLGACGLSSLDVKPFDPSEYSGPASSGQSNNRGSLSGPRGSRRLQMKHIANLMPGRPPPRVLAASAGTAID